MKKYKILSLALILVGVGCSAPDPEGVLNKKQMASVLIDMHIHEAEISELNLSPDSSSVLNQLMLQKTLQERNIADSVYLKSYHYYLANLKKFDEVYAIVIDSLKLRETMAAEQGTDEPAEASEE